MTSTQRSVLAIWGALLSAVVCLGFLPLPLRAATGITLICIGAIAVVWFLMARGRGHKAAIRFDNLPDASWRQPVVLVCGDISQVWPQESPVLVLSQGCWINVANHQDMEQVARHLLWLRPDWGRQLSLMVNISPQLQTDTETLTGRLLTLRWQLSQLRRETGCAIPLLLHAQLGCSMMHENLWQTAIADHAIQVWREGAPPLSVATWSASEGAQAVQSQVIIGSLSAWFSQHVAAVFTDENPDIPAVLPVAIVWGAGPALAGALPESAWLNWLRKHSAMQHVSGWSPAPDNATTHPVLPDFILPLLPRGAGLTPRQRLYRAGLTAFTFAAIVALCSSGWNNRQLLQRMNFDIQHFYRIASGDHIRKAEALKILQQDAAQLDGWARNGEPMSLGLGLYRGESLRLPILTAIRSYTPPSLPQTQKTLPKAQQEAAPQIIRLDSMSLFDSGKAELKAGSTKMLVNSLVGIKAKPGWLIVISGHTDNTGNSGLNQALSLKRAEAVRNWIRDTGDVPESCFAVQGYGQNRPIATNDTMEGRALNRRVEISLVPQADACQIPDKTPASSQDDDVSQHNGE
ncbi:OmpA family protein [Erwinia sp. S43]|uniref:OmpA family protein n=1 Tax=Erwinia sp. S43 TaxID=2769339 RepID=UPI00190A8B63|nr:OmpA family protein [Erwinia sp. S43]MBK0035355.1 OmpA family protein [Erwinia sp. S43]